MLCHRTKTKQNKKPPNNYNRRTQLIKSHGFFEKIWTKVMLGVNLAAGQRLGSKCKEAVWEGETGHSLTGHR